ncbi:RagB/SusD family nutrient uptake outer membrane protein [Deminuibacter soli]|uniref:RagB/SusD family nutrient uptake outer membrane protein n=1 Tax=Deminuibacter soli TaxID=2291815 RepID=A0A3E1NGU8_9BACT|nr:RagB/SusD family nutrient uptake outer membrane protein [Deminuibacter soli]RFM27107.1 RagB/SusD family nutrient uptake outer membrane protein [Deminuibacter soli]
MKSKKALLPMLLLICTSMACKKYVDVTNPDTFIDPYYWKDENSVKAYSWEFYNLFTGYGNGSSASGDFYFPSLTDDQAAATFTQYPQTTASTNGSWFFGYIRKANILLERVDLASMSDEAKNNWKGIAHFFRAYQYFQLVQTFGDVPWFSHSMDISDSANIYKPRDPRALVMDSVKADLDFAIANLRANAGDNTVNRDVALALQSRVCLYEGTYRKYHIELKLPNADDYLKASQDASSKLMASTYALSPDYQANYNSVNLGTNKEMILYKRYEPAYLTHSLIAYNYSSTAMNGLSKAAVESYLCSDGLPISSSPLYKGDNTIADLTTNRDRRLKVTIDTAALCYTGNPLGSFSSSTGYRPTKFLPATIDLTQVQIGTNVTDAPLFWLSEIYLNYAEASAELADDGKYNIVQSDIDNTINKLRARAKVAPLLLSNVPNDPKRDPSVSALLWEVRRERRVELMMDGFRLQDLYRWKKGDYMDSNKNPDSFLGAHVPANGKVTLNADGYIMPYKATLQRVFVDPKNYLSAIPTSQILLYPAAIQASMQNPGW